MKWELVQGQRQDIAHKLEAWKELTRLVPATAWLKSLQFEDDRVTASGLAQSASGILQAIDQSPYFQQPEFVTAISKDNEGREVFQIRMRPSPPRLRAPRAARVGTSAAGKGGR